MILYIATTKNIQIFVEDTSSGSGLIQIIISINESVDNPRVDRSMMPVQQAENYKIPIGIHMGFYKRRPHLILYM